MFQISEQRYAKSQHTPGENISVTSVLHLDIQYVCCVLICTWGATKDVLKAGNGLPGHSPENTQPGVQFPATLCCTDTGFSARTLSRRAPSAPTILQ